MAEQTFRSPGFFEQEIDLSTRSASQLGTPAGIIGTSDFGPAFVPVTIGSFSDFETRFGGLNPDQFGPYAVKEFLKRRSAVTFMRVLGAGRNETAADIANYSLGGVVKNAGFKVTPVAGSTHMDLKGRTMGNVQFIAAKHSVPANSDIGFPVYTDNDSFVGFRETSAAADTAHLIRAGLFTTTGSLFYILDDTDSITTRDAITTDLAAADATTSRFKLALYCGTAANRDTGDATFGTADGAAGFKVFTCSLDPDDSYYVGKILNTNPDRFQEEKHMLYWDFSVEHELATVGTTAGSIALVSGSQATVTAAGATVSGKYLELFGRFDTRYTAPKTTKFISQPFGNTEFDLFHFECLSDGAYANDKFKISIANIRSSTDPNNDYGTFEVQIRKFADNDLAPQILERYPSLSMDPNNERYIARVIGDYKVSFNFDDVDDDERRMVLSGKYPNKSAYIRVQMSDTHLRKEVPQAGLPFGFRGIPALQTNGDRINPTGAAVTSAARLVCSDSLVVGAANTSLTSSIVPPLPYRFKVTKGAVHGAPAFIGEPGIVERTEPRFYWGVKTDRLVSGSILNANAGTEINELVRTYTKMQGIQKLDALTAAGSASDSFHNHKFTLARVAFKQVLDSNGHIDTAGSLTGSSALHMLDAAYIRNGKVDPKTYTIHDAVNGTSRLSLASLLNSSSLLFNKFTGYAKFTNIFHGGFDGVNILDRDCARLNDRSASTETGGKAGDSITLGIGLSGGDAGTLMGSGKSNNIVASYRAAAEIMTDPMTVRTNILAIPGIRDPYITDFAADRNKDYSMSIYLMDIPNYDESTNRLFDNSTARPGVIKTVEEFSRRVFDNNYAATYFPDVFIEDDVNGGRMVKVPSSIAAIGALAFTDSVAYPWFAPAGFNRGSLDFVQNVTTRLTTNDRDELYDARINPIATFPGGDFVIFGQKTLQIAKSALDRVNVRRMMLELKRQVISVADKLLFEQNNQITRDRFINLVAPKLALIQAQQGIESFRIVMDDTNNTELDKESNRLNGKIIVVPTRTIEFISIDFIITNAGVSFE
tara:strand:+ start:27983 stop:31129 length:3147 start_codon:yes stop_codon:yes gene_type:complete